MKIIGRDGLDALIQHLRSQGYEVHGPKVRDGAIVHGPLSSIAELPEGMGEQREAGFYRLRERGDKALFGYVVGPQSWKSYLFPPQQTVFKVRRTEDGFSAEAPPPDTTKRAFLGVRACDVHAIAIQDRIFLNGVYQDTAYKARRENALIIAVNCTEPGATCFCTSMDTGPRAERGFDLALTELLDDQRHEFVLEVGSDLGESAIAGLDMATADEDSVALVAEKLEAAAGQMGRAMDTAGIKEIVYRNLEHPLWDDFADRCLSCGNCTMVCPTCFCSDVEDVTALDGSGAERTRHWDSCFNQAHSYIAGGSVRTATTARYRQWFSHKLASWIDQFDSSGCVGCGRCIDWCPVGIDITAYARRLRKTDQASRES